MFSIVTAICVIAAGTIGLVYAIVSEMPLVHMMTSAFIALLVAGVAYGHNKRATAAGADLHSVAAMNALYMALIWGWGALALVVFYNYVLIWEEWWQFFAIALALSALCLIFSVLLNRDDGRDKAGGSIAGSPVSDGLIKLSRYLAMGQLAGMILAMAGLLIDGKMIRYLTPRYTDWAANNVFFFGALALAIISFTALRSHQKLSS